MDEGGRRSYRLARVSPPRRISHHILSASVWSEEISGQVRLLHRHIMAIQHLDPVRLPELILHAGIAIDEGRKAGDVPPSGGNAQEPYCERSSWPVRTYVRIHTFLDMPCHAEHDGVASKTNNLVAGREEIILVARRGWLEGSSVV